eukprot:TRINITY_DN1767_c0_g1_i9.p2 TRINITY_DN1767_c0_g1~~TRINITY_DN1767_c0_g1_i9.p2  ORF type:complete len:157 (+),score=32.59 TRINITY_DN1767_c0_g1_i9:176-646(+)
MCIRDRYMGLFLSGMTEKMDTLLDKQMKLIQEELKYTPYMDPKTKEKHYLTTEVSKERARVVSNLSYMMALILHKGEKYLGFVDCEFTLSDTSDMLFFDFNGYELVYFSCNDKIVPGAEAFEQRKIMVPKIHQKICLLYTSPSPRDLSTSRMPSSA